MTSNEVEAMNGDFLGDRPAAVSKLQSSEVLQLVATGHGRLNGSRPEGILRARSAYAAVKTRLLPPTLAVWFSEGGQRHFREARDRLRRRS
jgi:hypothetical protein